MRYLLCVDGTSDPDTLFCFFTPGRDQMKYLDFHAGSLHLLWLVFFSISLNVLLISYLFFKQSVLNTGDSSLKYIFSGCFNPMNRRNIQFFFSSPPFTELPENWTDTRETILEGMTFNLRHLGMTLVDQPKGEELSAAAVKRIVATVRSEVKSAPTLAASAPHDQQEFLLLSSNVSSRFGRSCSSGGFFSMLHQPSLYKPGSTQPLLV